MKLTREQVVNLRESLNEEKVRFTQGWAECISKLIEDWLAYDSPMLEPLEKLEHCRRDYPLNGHEWMLIEQIDALVDRVNALWEMRKG